MKGTIVAVCRSEQTGTRKEPCGEGIFIENYGMGEDAHAAQGIARQVSLLSVDSIDKMKALGLELNPGDFAENLTVEGMELLFPARRDEAPGGRGSGSGSQSDREDLPQRLRHFQSGGRLHHAEGGRFRPGDPGREDRRRRPC